MYLAPINDHLDYFYERSLARSWTKRFVLWVFHNFVHLLNLICFDWVLQETVFLKDTQDPKGLLLLKAFTIYFEVIIDCWRTTSNYSTSTKRVKDLNRNRWDEISCISWIYIQITVQTMTLEWLLCHTDKNCSNNLVAICALRCWTDRGGISNSEGLSKNSWHRCGLGWAAQRSTGWKAINDCCLFAYGLLFEFLSRVRSPFLVVELGIINFL